MKAHSGFSRITSNVLVIYRLKLSINKYVWLKIVLSNPPYMCPAARCFAAGRTVVPCYMYINMFTGMFDAENNDLLNQ